ncbi:MAG: DUF362 domain-containing protein, partial [Chloroflexi bacterium]|nr:DUF362 domain-containing protein [Chloroflexota bacterium]
MPQFSRRRFLRLSSLAGLALAASSCTPRVAPTEPFDEPTDRPAESTDASAANPAAAPQSTAIPTHNTPTASPGAAYIAVVHGEDAAAITLRAVEAIGGIERFVKSGYNVIIKPNICNANNGPEYASTTNPDVVAALVRMCRGAGAKRVR